MTAIDFTSCPRIPVRAYNGANGKKIAVLFQGDPWILKFPPNVLSRPNEQSNSNSCFSEHLGSSIYRLLGVTCQETVLGIFVNGKTKIVCACKDFTRPGVRLYDFCSIKNTVIDSETGGMGTELSDILETIERQSFVDPVIVYERFWQILGGLHALPHAFATPVLHTISHTSTPDNVSIGASISIMSLLSAFVM